jgi:hypothetical protein
MSIHHPIQWREAPPPLEKFHCWLADGPGVSSYAIAYDYGCNTKCPEYRKFVVSWKSNDKTDPRYLGFYDTIAEAMLGAEEWNARTFGASASTIPSPSSSRSSHLPPGSLGSRYRTSTGRAS